MLKSFSLKPVHASLLKKIFVPEKILCGPGPSNAHVDVLKALSLPLIGHLHNEFTQIMDEVKHGIQYLFQTESKWSLAVSGTGHCAMEAALINLLESGETVLVCSNGIWGERFADLADRFKIHAPQLAIEPGKTFTLQEIEQGLINYSPQLVFIVHGESSTGALQNLEGIGPLCHRYGALLLVDSVAAAGGVPLFMDEWQIDCLYTGSQKVLGCSPGICPISFNDRAQSKILNRKTRVPSFYLDMNHLANYWGCDGEARRYHHTGPINLVYGLRESLRILAAEGLEQSWKRHHIASQKLQAGLVELGLDMLVTNFQDRAPTVNAVKVPPGVDWKAVAMNIMTKHNIEIAGGLGSTVGKIWRIGLMGQNANEVTVEKVLSSLSDELKTLNESKL